MLKYKEIRFLGFVLFSWILFQATGCLVTYDLKGAPCKDKSHCNGLQCINGFCLKPVAGANNNNANTNNTNTNTNEEAGSEVGKESLVEPRNGAAVDAGTEVGPEIGPEPPKPEVGPEIGPEPPKPEVPTSTFSQRCDNGVTCLSAASIRCLSLNPREPRYCVFPCTTDADCSSSCLKDSVCKGKLSKLVGRCRRSQRPGASTTYCIFEGCRRASDCFSGWVCQTPHNIPGASKACLPG